MKPGQSSIRMTTCWFALSSPHALCCGATRPMATSYVGPVVVAGTAVVVAVACGSTIHFWSMHLVGIKHEKVFTASV